MKKILALCLVMALCLCVLSSCGVFGFYSISYSGEMTEGLIKDGYKPTFARAGDTVAIRTGRIIDANLSLYANGVECKQTYAGSEYWEYVFTMPDEDVVITSDIFGGM